MERILGGIIKGFLRSIAKAVFGTLIGVFGVAVLSIGLVKYLATLLRIDWAAWLIVGLVLILAGAGVFYSAMPKRR